jgi:anti-sigma regulatory factor (Ser/Thr protein kinase)
MFVRHTLIRWNLPELVDDAELITSELVTNAVKVTGICTPEPSWGELEKLNLISVFVRATGAGICVQVWDADDEPLDLLTAGPDDEDENGRGLFLVRTYARQVGRFYPKGGGKVVWAELPLERPEPALPRRVAGNRATIRLSRPDPELLRAVLEGLKRL